MVEAGRRIRLEPVLLGTQQVGMEVAGMVEDLVVSLVVAEASDAVEVLVALVVVEEAQGLVLLDRPDQPLCPQKDCLDRDQWMEVALVPDRCAEGGHQCEKKRVRLLALQALDADEQFPHRICSHC